MLTRHLNQPVANGEPPFDRPSDLLNQIKKPKLSPLKKLKKILQTRRYFQRFCGCECKLE